MLSRLRCSRECLQYLNALLLTAGLLLAAHAAAAASTLNATAVLSLNATLSGYAISTTEDPGYDVVYETWNNLQQGINPVMPHSEPAVYVKAAGIPDVLVALEFAIVHGLKTSFMPMGTNLVMPAYCLAA